MVDFDYEPNELLLLLLLLLKSDKGLNFPTGDLAEKKRVLKQRFGQENRIPQLGFAEFGGLRKLGGYQWRNQRKERVHH